MLRTHLMKLSAKHCARKWMNLNGKHRTERHVIKRMNMSAKLHASEWMKLREGGALGKRVVKAYVTAKAKVGRFFSSSNPLAFRRNMAQQIKEIRKRLDGVAADRDKFGLRIIHVGRQVVHAREMTRPDVEREVIGRDHDKEEIIQLLTQQNPFKDGKRTPVIPIVGFGGLGKTTLARYVFGDKRITESFPLKMWVCVPVDFDIKQLIIKIINSATDFASNDLPICQRNLKELDIQPLANLLGKRLDGQKFLLVLHDVWNDDLVKWVELRDLIHVVGAEGSKILVTTRSHRIASMMGTVSSHNLEGLSLKDSLSLLVKWAFKEGEEEKYPNLIVIGREIVKKCGGVPLAVRTLGTLLFLKYEIDEWESVRGNEIWNLPKDKDVIFPALKLSYDHMPSYLRQCFAMFSLFPKGHEFHGFEVTSLWGALGLLPSPNKNKNLQDVANRYLSELMSRSFIQYCLNFGTAYYFTMHDLVHDLASYVAKDECLLVKSNTRDIPESAQHLSFVGNNVLGKSSTPKSVGVKTILFPIYGMGVDDKALLDTWLSMYKHLRILDLSHSTCETLPLSIGQLKQLRYLNLCNNKAIKRLPDSICHLRSLQVFKLRGCTELETLPKGLRGLINLRDFEITTKQLVLPENEIANLRYLQNLDISSCNNIVSLFDGIELHTLKALHVNGCRSLKFLPLSHFPQSETLLVQSCDTDKLEWSSAAHESNLTLKLIGLYTLPQLVTLPHWIQGCANTLQSLIISDCRHLDVLQL